MPSEATREYKRAWYAANREMIRVQQREYRAANPEAIAARKRACWLHNRGLIVAEKLRRGACLHCGLVVTPDNLVVFDFDHRDRAEKFGNIAKLATISVERLTAEMVKCDLLCANCHRLKTHSERDWGQLDAIA